MSRVVQGILTGIGFLGAGAIIKHKDKEEVQGLTTAAGIWLTTTVGIAVGFGHLALATIATALAFVILQLLAKWSDRIG
jgi:putative Mg2+ transporter-C (MgtC) family protein